MVDRIGADDQPDRINVHRVHDYLEDVYVEDGHRGRGLGKELVAGNDQASQTGNKTGNDVGARSES